LIRRSSSEDEGRVEVAEDEELVEDDRFPPRLSDQAGSRRVVIAESDGRFVWPSIPIYPAGAPFPCE
jgi:hypothetical protein